MKVKTLSGIVLGLLSFLSVAAEKVVVDISASNLSRSPFQVDREKSGSLMKHQEVVGSQRSLNTVASGRTTSATEYSVAQGAPRLTLTLQERHLLSQDISAWAKTQGMSPLWNSNRDYLIYSTINLTGKNRDEVLNQLGQLFLSENYGLVVKLYEKNNVLVIDGQ